VKRPPVQRPSPCPRTVSLPRAAGLLLMTLLAVGISSAPAAHASSEMEILGFDVASDTLFCRFDIDEVFFDRLIETIERGLSATIKYTIELWVPRRSWFDRLFHSEVVAYKIRYDSWSEEYVALGPEGELDAHASPRELSVMRAGLNRIPVLGVDRLEPDRTYYVTLNVQVQPLTVEEVRELEVWLRGTWGGAESGTGSRTMGISKGLFGLVKSLTGFGDEVVSARSENFSLMDLR